MGVSPKGPLLFGLVVLSACGARSFLDDPQGDATAVTTSGTSAVGGAAGGIGGQGAMGGQGEGGVLCAAEVCDGRDNDCDGEVDEADPALEEPCDTGLLGECAVGVPLCDGGGLVCEQTVLPSLEACDDIDTDCDGLSDPASCTKIVFATSSLYSGDLGGLGGADEICQTHADAVGLAGVFKAWLSDSSQSALERLAHHEGPYAMVDGNLIATSWADLIDGDEILRPIDVTELGTAPPEGTACEGLLEGGPVWTNTLLDGSTYNVDYDCDDWTSTGANTVQVGAFGSALNWSGACTWGYRDPPVCSGSAILYCFEQ